MSKLIELLKDYKHIESEIYNYFGYEQEWREFPIADETEYEWYLHDTDEVLYAKNLKEQYKDESFYGGEIRNNKIYRAHLYTMIIVDTHCDGNVYCMIFDNNKEIKDL